MWLLVSCYVFSLILNSLVSSYFMLSYHNMFRNFLIFKWVCSSKKKKKKKNHYIISSSLLNLFCIIMLLIKAPFCATHPPISVSALGVPPHGHRPEVLRVGLVTKVGRPEVDVCVPLVAQARGAHLPQLL